MNKTLALYFDDHFLIGAVEPFDGKFTLLEKNNREKFYLYFYIDNHQIDYGQSYQREIDNQDPKLIKDFYERICEETTFSFQGYEHSFVTLLNPIIEDIHDSYQKIIARLSDNPDGMNTSDEIPVKLGFSPNLHNKAVSAIQNYLADMRFEVNAESSPDEFDQLILQAMVDRRELESGDYAIVEGLNDDLNVTLVNINPTMAIKRLTEGSYPGFGTDPRIGVISKYVVDKANENIHILHSQTEKDLEYKRKTILAHQWNEQLLKSRRPYTHVSVSLSQAPQSESKIPIQKREIDSLTKARSLQVARYVEHTLGPHIDMQALTKIIIIGDSLINSQVLDGFYRYGKDKLMVMGNEKVVDTVKGLLAQKTLSPFEDIPVEINEAIKEAIPDRFPLKTVRVFDLEPGDRLEFTWDPNREVTAEYQGNGSFMIVSHLNSSVIAGDKFVTDHITVGERAYLRNVVRTSTGKVLGNYKSGVIMTLFKV